MKLYQLLLLVTLFWHTKAECQCGIFIMGSNESVEDEVHLGSTFPQNCERLEVDQLCRDFCYQNFSNMTANGNLSSISPIFNATSGDFFCDTLNKEVTNEELAGFYRWCQTSWKFVGIKATEKLCCGPKGTYLRCEEEFIEWTTQISRAIEEDLEETGINGTSNSTTSESIVIANSTENRHRRHITSELPIESTTLSTWFGKSATEEEGLESTENGTDSRQRRSINDSFILEVTTASNETSDINETTIIPTGRSGIITENPIESSSVSNNSDIPQLLTKRGIVENNILMSMMMTHGRHHRVQTSTTIVPIEIASTEPQQSLATNPLEDVAVNNGGRHSVHQELDNNDEDLIVSTTINTPL